MDKLWMALPGAALAGLGAVLGAVGTRQVRLPSLTLTVGVFAGSGAAAGAMMGYPAFAAGLCVVGAMLAVAFHAPLVRVTTGLAAAMGGAAVGLLLSVIFHTSHPAVLCAATGAGAAVLAVLDERLLTIGWTSAAGAALVAHGLLRSAAVLANVPPGQLAWTLAVIFVVLFGAGFAFQMRTTAEQHVTTQIAPVPSA